jgi:catechol 2,3-dioxygenase-like lactoylglutathione lyase family enzyme
MDWSLEVIAIPVSDVDRAKAFYTEQVGFVLDVDHRAGDAFRVVQVTPPGSACSVTFGVGMLDSAAAPVKGLQLVVSDVVAAQAELAARGVDVSPVRHFEDGQMLDGPGGDWNSFVFFADPDGNAWAVQQKPAGGGSPS